MDRKGNVYIADTTNTRIRKVSPGGKITTIAGNGKDAGSHGDGGPATSAPLVARWQSQWTGKGTSTSPTISTRIRRVDPQRDDHDVRRLCSCSNLGDGGPATSAELGHPRGVAVDAKGNVYVADNRHHRVRKVSPDGTITTFAGTGGPRLLRGRRPGDLGAAGRPWGLAVDRKGNVYIADNGNARVRRVSPGGTIQTIAGTGKRGVYKDGMRATSAPLAQVVAVAVDLRGNVYISALGVIFVVSPRGRITRFAGNGNYT